MTETTVSLTISAEQGGSVYYVGDVGSGTVSAGTSTNLQLSDREQLFLTVTPAAGYRFSSWSASSGITDTNGAPIDPISASMYIVVNSDSLMTANFCRIARPGTPAKGPWAGYVVGTPSADGSSFLSGTVSNVTGTWMVPKLPPGRLFQAYNTWVGIGGFDSGYLVQIGTAVISPVDIQFPDICGNVITPGPFAWYEVIVPGSGCMSTISPFSVSPGDTISAEVSYLEPDMYKLTIANVTQGNSTNIYVSQPSNPNDTAEWIVENPEAGHGFGLYRLADFGVLNFNDCSVTLNSEPSSINGGCDSEYVATVLTNNIGTIMAQPCCLSPDGTSFSVVNLDLAGADLQNADLQGANLQGANLAFANLSNANLQGANLQGANLRGANFDPANLSGANLSGADASGANFQGADLQGAILEGTILIGANLKQANLSGADLSGADLVFANLQGANLQNANFTNAMLCGANLRGANTTGAIFTGAKTQGCYEWPWWVYRRPWGWQRR